MEMVVVIVVLVIVVVAASCDIALVSDEAEILLSSLNSILNVWVEEQRFDCGSLMWSSPEHIGDECLEND